MTSRDKEKLLKDKRVVDEINRHLWIESEKQGRDVGFEAAAEDWLSKYADEWMKFNAPEMLKKRNGGAKKTTGRKRGAKSYVK